MADEEKPARKKMSEVGWAFFNVARNPSGQPYIGAIIKDPEDNYIFVDRESLVSTIGAHGESADVIQDALDAVEKAERGVSPLSDRFVKRNFSH